MTQSHQSDTTLVKAPPTLWQKSVKVNVSSLLMTLLKSAIDYGSNNKPAAAKGLIDVLTSAGITTTEGETAWLLITNSMMAALKDLFKEQAFNVDNPQVTDDLERVCNDFADHLAATQYHIEAQFFERPQTILTAIGWLDHITQLFVKLGYSDASAQALANRFEAYFVFALRGEWRDNAAYYQKSFASIHTPFDSQSQQQETLALYKAHLIKQAHESVFGEPISLKQIYIPLNGYTYTEEYDADHSTNGAMASSEVTKKKRVVKLHDALSQWVRSTDSNTPMVRVISGGPGAGKSTFTKIWAAEVIEQLDYPVLYIPLHYFSLQADLASALTKYFQSLPHFSAMAGIFEQATKLLLIFDGLDELSMQGRQAELVANQFVDEVIRTLHLKNNHGGHIKALITGRDLSIQNNEDKLRLNGQILHILSYCEPVDQSQRQAEWLDPDQLLLLDLRDRWWQQYGQLKSLPERALPAVFKQGRLNEISSQPLLNYLLAISYQAQRIAFDENTRLDQVYEDLITGVYHRQYDGGKSGTETRHVSAQLTNNKADFIRILEEVALAIWHQGGRQATEAHIAKQIQSAGLQPLFSKFQEVAKSGVTRLLMAFYFRQGQAVNAGQATFEWTHKSFGEYLVARRLIRLLKLMATQIDKKQHDPDDGWHLEEALAKLVQLGGQNAIDDNTRSFLTDILKSKPLPDINRWQQILAGFINYLAASRLPMESIKINADNNDKFGHWCRWSRNAEELIFVLHHSCGQLTDSVSAIHWPQPDAFKLLYHRVLLPGSASTRNFNGSLGYLDFSGQDLTGLFFHAVDFTRSRFERAEFRFSAFWRTRFYQAELRDCDFFYSTLLNCDFRQADCANGLFDSVRIEGCDFTGTTVTECSFGGVILTGSPSDIRGVIGLDKAHFVPEEWLAGEPKSRNVSRKKPKSKKRG